MINRCIIASLAVLMIVSAASAQFIDNFDGSELVRDTSGLKGWTYNPESR